MWVTIVHIIQLRNYQKHLFVSPRIGEQTENMETIFTNIDHLITLHQRQYQKLFQ